jgi:hypothetical protein
MLTWHAELPADMAAPYPNAKPTHPLQVPFNYHELFRLDDPVGGEHMNVMKAGAITAHRMIAVSHG